MRYDWLTRVECRVAPNMANRLVCEPNWRLKDDWSDRLSDFDLWYVWDGVGQMTLTGGESVPLRAGRCFWARPGRYYAATHDPERPLGVTFIHFDCLADGRRVPDDWLPPDRATFEDVTLIDAMLAQIVRRVHADRPEQANPMLRAALVEYALATARGRTGGPGRDMPRHRVQQIQRLVQQVRERPASAPSVAEMAQQCNCHPDHFARLFKRVTGLPPQRYLLRVKTQRAQSLLSESDLTVSEIAEALGYPDVFFFSRQLKQQTGQSPSHYRKRPGSL